MPYFWMIYYGMYRCVHVCGVDVCSVDVCSVDVCSVDVCVCGCVCVDVGLHMYVMCVDVCAHVYVEYVRMCVWMCVWWSSGQSMY